MIRCDLIYVKYLKTTFSAVISNSSLNKLKKNDHYVKLVTYSVVRCLKRFAHSLLEFSCNTSKYENGISLIV